MSDSSEFFFLTFLPDCLWHGALSLVQKTTVQLGEAKSLQRWSRLWKAGFPQPELT